MRLWPFKKSTQSPEPPREGEDSEMELPPLGEFENHGPAIRPDFDPKEIWDLEAQRRAQREQAEKNQ